MFAKPVTIEIVASGAGPAEISLLTSGLTTAEYVGDAGAFAFQVLQEGEGKENADAPPPTSTPPPPPPGVVTFSNMNHNNVKVSNLRAEHKDKVYSRSNGHLPQNGHHAVQDRLPGLDEPLARKQFSASNGSLPNNQVPTKNNNNKNFFFSRKNDTQGAAGQSTTGTSMTFLQSLDAKLQRLHDYTRGRSRVRRAAPDTGTENNNNKNVVQHPKPFMTVVRQGTFLKPPPELAALLGLSMATPQGSGDSSLNASQHAARHGDRHAASLNSSMLYSFSSRPRVLMQAHRHHCEAAHQAAHQAPHQAHEPTARAKRAVPEQEASPGGSEDT